MNLRPRMSLLTLLLVMTIAALSVSMWKLGREVLPLKEEVRQLRSEVGKLSINDPTKIYVMQLDSADPNVWRWRVYLPPGRKFQLHNRLHTIPGLKNSTARTQWLGQLLANRSGSSSEIISGEYTIEVSLKSGPEAEDYWHLRTRTPGRNFFDVTVGTTMEWVRDRRAWSLGGDLRISIQKVFDLDNGVELLMLRKSKVSELPNGFSVQAPDTQEDCPGIAVWITLEE